VDLFGARRTRAAFVAMAFVLYAVAYYPSWRMPFRVEELDIYYFYATQPFNPLSATDWGRMAFWTPFYDFRMLPLAYLWNFALFKVVGPSFVAYWLISVALDLVNAALLARWVGARLSANARPGVQLGAPIQPSRIQTGWIAAAFFLLFPAKHEIVLWTFFTYKLVHTGLVLGTLILFEEFFRTHKRTHLIWGLALMFLSWFFYETSLPLGFALVLGMLLFGGFSRREVLRTVAVLAIPYIAYAALYLLAKRHIPPLYGHAVPSLERASLEAMWLALRAWVWHGMFLANSGLPLYADSAKLVSTLAMVVRPSLFWGLLVVGFWTSFMALMRWRRAPWRSIAYALGLMVLLNALVLVGRAATNDTPYLAHMSMYQYIPTLVLAAIVGMLAETSLSESTWSACVADSPARRRLLVATTTLCLTLLWSSSAVAVRSYVSAQKPLMDILQDVERRCAVPGARIAAANYRLPFTPDTPLMPPEDHSFRAFSLLGKNCVAPPSPDEQASALLREAPTDIPTRVSASFEDQLELIGSDMPASVRPGKVFRMILYFKVGKKPMKHYKQFVHFQDVSVKFQGDHEVFKDYFQSYHWTPGDYIRDVFEVQAGDAETPIGTYSVWAGVYSGVNGQWTNMKVVRGKHDADNRIFLGTIQVQE